MSARYGKILVAAAIASLALYVLCVPLVYAQWGSDRMAYVLAVKYCPRCANTYRSFTWDGMPEELTLILTTEWRADCEHDLRILDSSEAVCGKCGANRLTYFLGERIVAGITRPSGNGICEPGGHVWQEVSARKSTVEEECIGSWQNYRRIGHYGFLGLLLLLWHLITVVVILKPQPPGLKESGGYYYRRSAHLISFAAGAVVCGFVQVLATTVRFVNLFAEEEIAPSLVELKREVLGSYWPVLGMAAFTALMTFLTASAISILRHRCSSGVQR